MHAQFALTQLNPMGQDVVLRIDIICQFTDIFHTLLLFSSIAVVEQLDFMNHAVYQRHDGIHQRNLGLLLHIETFLLLHMKTNQGNLLFQLFTPFVQTFIMFIAQSTLAMDIEQPHDNRKKD